MQRLTKKINKNRRKYRLITNADLYPGYYVVDDYCLRLDEAIDKLGKQEDIEEDLGIDLVILFKTINQRHIYVREHNTEEKEIVAEPIKPNFINHTFDFIDPRKEIGKGRPFSMYGKTWALTREELNGKNN